MNLIDALKTGGKHVRRKEGGPWFVARSCSYTVEEIFSDIWEVEEERIEITESELGRAVSTWLTNDCGSSWAECIMKELKKLKEAVNDPTK